MDDIILAALLIIGGFVCIPLPCIVLMGGLYIKASMEQSQLTMRESMRTQKAIAKMNLEGGLGDGDDGGGLDIFSILNVLSGMRGQPPQQPTQVTTNGIQTQQADR